MLILASQSPRRAELLQQIEIPFTQMNVDIDESVLVGESQVEYVRRLAMQKSAAGWKIAGEVHPTLGADTIVVVQNEILGKPVNQADSKRMLELLSDTQHKVYTAVALSQNSSKGMQQSAVVVETTVSFCRLSDEKIEHYWQTGEPQDKAGSYGIQGIGGQFVKHIKGSYSAVVGLPLYETHQLLSEMGVL